MLRLQIQQPTLCRQPSTKAGERAIAAYHAMTRNDDGYGVVAVGSTYCSNRFGVANGIGNVFVAAHLTVRNVEQCIQNLVLELCRWWRQRKIKRAALARKVLL